MTQRRRKKHKKVKMKCGLGCIREFERAKAKHELARPVMGTIFLV